MEGRSHAGARRRIVPDGMRMVTSRAGRRQVREGARSFALAVALTALGLGGCITPPGAVSETAYESRAVTQQRNGLSVTAVPLSDHESRAVFGVSLAAFDVQPVWIRIENRSAWPRWFFPVSVDPDYYPAYEVARRVASFTAPTVKQLYIQLSERAIKPFVVPGETVSGFVYAHSDEGFKAFNIDLVGHDEIETFHYALAVPGLLTDADALALDSQKPTPSLDDDGLRQWLKELPCCTASDGRPGDPLNVVLVGSLHTVRSTLVSRHWDVTARLTTGSGWQMAKDFLFGSPDRYAPVSALYTFGRVQDTTFQKSRNVIEERNHMRLWLAPVAHRGQPVWVGQISRDVGVELTGHLWPLTTHVIGPDVDDARYYLVEDLLYGGRIRRIGFVDGVGQASLVSPRHNAEGDPYFTDGLRAVLFLSDEAVPFSEVELLNWQLPTFMKPFQPDEWAIRFAGTGGPNAD
jgi:LssY C-terminus